MANRKKLDSWKEVAAYLGRSTRTARRWEQAEQLPVYRHEHRRGTTVYAYTDEIDRWLQSRSSGGASTADEQRDHASTRAGRRRLLWAVLAVLNLWLLAFVWLSQPEESWLDRNSLERLLVTDATVMVGQWRSPSSTAERVLADQDSRFWSVYEQEGGLSLGVGDYELRNSQREATWSWHFADRADVGVEQDDVLCLGPAFLEGQEHTCRRYRRLANDPNASVEDRAKFEFGAYGARSEVLRFVFNIRPR